MSTGMKLKRTDLTGLEALALTQGGYFDRGDALAHGLTDRLLHYHVGTGRFERIYPGVYRLHNAPIVPHDDLFLAWVWSNYRGAISHDSALALYSLGDVMPLRVHITAPLSFRRETANYDVHLSDLPAEDMAMYEGVQVTTPARSIVDAASNGLDPEQVQRTVAQAVRRGLASPNQLLAIAGRPRYRHRRTVQPLIEGALQHAAT